MTAENMSVSDVCQWVLLVVLLIDWMSRVTRASHEMWEKEFDKHLREQFGDTPKEN